MVLANFCRRRVFGYRMMILTTLAIGGLGILVWGHHMFVVGLNPFAGTAFSISTMAIAIPSAAKVLSWLATTWRARPTYPAAMLFALGFVSLFVAGGLTGPSSRSRSSINTSTTPTSSSPTSTSSMAMAGIFGLFMATYYWFPLLCGRQMNETLGRWHFWLTFLGAYLTFLPMHIAGLMGAPRHYAQFTGLPPAAAALLTRSLPMQRHITYAAVLLISAQLLFLINLIRSWRSGAPAAANPWSATTLEWMPHASNQQDRASNPQICVHCPPCQYSLDKTSQDFQPQWANLTKAE